MPEEFQKTDLQVSHRELDDREIYMAAEALRTIGGAKSMDDLNHSTQVVIACMVAHLCTNFQIEPEQFALAFCQNFKAIMSNPELHARVVNTITQRLHNPRIVVPVNRLARRFNQKASRGH